MHINTPLMITGDGTRWSTCAKCRKVFGLSDGMLEGSHICCGGCGQNLLLKKMSNVEWEALSEQFPQPASPVMTTYVRGSHNIETGEVIEPLHKRVGLLDAATGVMHSERDSAEADAAQELFVECGVKVSVLENLCAEPVSLVTTLQWWPKGGFKTIGAEFGKQLRPSQMPMWDLAPVGGGKTVVIERALGAVAALYDVPFDRLLGHKAALNAKYGRFNNDLAEYWDRIATAQVDSLRDEIENGAKRYNAAREKAVLGCVAQAAFKLGDNERRYLMRNERNRANSKVKRILAKELRACGLSYSQLEIIVSNVVESVRNV
jgi:hypothetical protein